MEKKLKSEIITTSVLVFVCKLLLVLCLAVSAGCVSSDDMESESELAFYMDSVFEVPILPPSAEKRLLDVLNGRGILEINELAYISEDPTYLIFDGLIALETGSVDGPFILKKDIENKTWCNAGVYRWKNENVEYIDHHGEKIKRHLMYASELIFLPEHVRTNLIEKYEKK